MKKAILTGGNGFIGFALTTELVRHGYDVYALIRSSSLETFTEKTRSCGLTETEIASIHAIPGDLLYPEHIESALKEACHDPDVFFHIAWNGSAGPARANLRLQMENVVMAENMVSLAAAIGCKKFVGAGSIMEDEVLKTALEGGRTTINQIYSSAKLQAHLACRIKAESLGLCFCWGKITNAYGAEDTTGRFIDNFTGKMIRNESCSFSKADQLYDFIHISDAAKAFRLIGENGKDFRHYVVGSGKPVILKDYIEKMARLTGTSSVITFSQDASAIIYLPHSSFDTKQFEEDTGYRSSVDFEDGISKIIEKKRSMQ
ncbi:MAG: NAD(P)-dependent oxidoreductase [Clostridiales bacterium]|nr:NAD(P)-dependent oxidoreductase [Clostridiales bacterium]